MSYFHDFHRSKMTKASLLRNATTPELLEESLVDRCSKVIADSAGVWLSE